MTRNPRPSPKATVVPGPSRTYSGLWAARTDIGIDDWIEMDLYLGYRGTLRKLSYGISDYSYVYEKVGFNYPEAIAKTAWVVPDSLALEAILGAPFGGFMRTRSCPSTRSPPLGQPAHGPESR